MSKVTVTKFAWTDANFGAGNTDVNPNLLSLQGSKPVTALYGSPVSPGKQGMSIGSEMICPANSLLGLIKR